jgi:hypothetical protein
MPPGTSTKRRRKKVSKKLPAVTRVTGMYPPTVTTLKFSDELGVWYAYMHDNVFIYTSAKEMKNQPGDRLCFKFSAKGTTGWAYDGDGKWVGVFTRGEDEK